MHICSHHLLLALSVMTAPISLTVQLLAGTCLYVVYVQGGKTQPRTSRNPSHEAATTAVAPTLLLALAFVPAWGLIWAVKPQLSSWLQGQTAGRKEKKRKDYTFRH